jgi:hypothetical protein
MCGRYTNDWNLQLVLSAYTDTHASFFSGAWKFVNFSLIINVAVSMRIKYLEYSLTQLPIFRWDYILDILCS